LQEMEVGTRPSILSDKNVQFVLTTDLDHTLVKHENNCRHAVLLRFNRIWQDEYSDRSLLVYSTGRSPTKYKTLQNEVPLLMPDVLVCSVGTEIFWREKNGNAFRSDRDWYLLLDQGWEPEKIHNCARSLGTDALTLQEESEQRPHKISFNVESQHGPSGCQSLVERLQGSLKEQGIQAQVIFSGGKDLDILPVHAGKGNGLAYVLNELKGWNCYPSHGVLVAGDSGNDIDLFKVDGVMGCIVSNAMPELVKWAKEHGEQHNIYKATEECASGIIEALDHFEVFRPRRFSHLINHLLGHVGQVTDGHLDDPDFLSNSFIVVVGSEQVSVPLHAVHTS